jgi:hypothetical protein
LFYKNSCSISNLIDFKQNHVDLKFRNIFWIYEFQQKYYQMLKLNSRDKHWDFLEEDRSVMSFDFQWNWRMKSSNLLSSVMLSNQDWEMIKSILVDMKNMNSFNSWNLQKEIQTNQFSVKVKNAVFFSILNYFKDRQDMEIQTNFHFENLVWKSWKSKKTRRKWFNSLMINQNSNVMKDLEINCQQEKMFLIAMKFLVISTTPNSLIC